MAISRLSGQDALGASTTTSVSATYAGTPTVGNTMIASIYANVGIGLDTITGWTNIVSMAFSGTAQSIEIFARVVQAGDSSTVTCSGAIGATIMRMHIYEYSGLATALTTDGTNSNSSGVTSVTSINSSNITTTNANDLLFVATATGGTSTAQSFNNSFNIRQVDASAARLFDADMIVSSTSTYSTTASWTTSLRAGIAFATFKGTPDALTTFGSTLAMMGVG